MKLPILQLFPLASFLLVAVAVFAVEALTPGRPALISNFLDALKFFLAIAIGWHVQTLVSREEFETQLRRYALSAYRRVSDISLSVARIKGETLAKGTKDSDARARALHAIDAVADELANTVRSAIVDWADIIGNEILKVQRIEELRQQARLGPLAREAASPPDRMQEVELEIKNLKRQLPILLQASLGLQEDMMPREGRLSLPALRSLLASVRDKSEVMLTIQHLASPDQPPLAGDQPQGPFTFWIDTAMGSDYLVARDRYRNDIGQVINPFEEEGVYHKDYHQTLLMVLPTHPETDPTGMGSFNVEGAEYAGPAAQQGHFYIRIPIASDYRTELLTSRFSWLLTAA